MSVVLAQVLMGDGHFRVYRSAAGCHALHTTAAHAAGAVLAHFTIARRLPQAHRYTIQLDESTHALVEPVVLQFMNHSCRPNVVLDTEALEVRALRPIAPDDEITFFYPSTEWSMAEPFRCTCGAAGCLGTIAGAAHLPRAVVGRYEFAGHVRRLLEERSSYSPG